MKIQFLQRVAERCRRWLRRGLIGAARRVTSRTWPQTFALSREPTFQRDFPNFKPHQCDPSSVSAATPAYNCIAWAASDVTRWWEPDPFFNFYWPAGVDREYTVEAYADAYRTIGYEPCRKGSLEIGVEKIALFALSGEPTHAARQLSDGSWTSKFGRAEDIGHITLACVVGPQYGTVCTYMKRRTS